ncbi:MAG: cation diffusion facilitator family transporter [Oscillospiraceae bacterium]|jgi:cation diffusion facilitator family transporter|nr:cation diffusion facilitator family transporter [Oscillospiraceae bacterium]
MGKNPIRTAAVIALAGNAVLAGLKIAAGAVSGSGALVSDGIDSGADALISLMTLAVVRVIEKPADAGHPWGHGRAETVMTAFLSFLLFFTGGQLIVNAASTLLAGETSEPPGFLAVLTALVSIAGKVLLAASQYALGKRANSGMLRANAKNMASDAVVSGGVLIGLAIANLTGSSVADTALSGLIGAWIIKTAVGIFLEANLELMDGNRDTGPYHVIVDAVNAVEGAGNPHRARMRRVAGFWDIDFDIDVDPAVTVADAHRIANRVEDEIKLRLANVFDIMIHVEPQGDDTDERFGLDEEMMRREKKDGSI